MTEFKIADALEDEITALQNAGNALRDVSNSISDNNVSTLKTAVRFAVEHQAIMDLVDLYRQLVDKEASDLREMKRTAEELDETIAGKLR